ncbi:hypothetical protein JW898_02595 [Candidatus Woesearchaeota archaeon]|nr:hypothetical protein [Candidatus Woesearchaeota archaeon]
MQEQAQASTPAKDIYSDGIKEAGKLDTQSGRKANMIQRAYEAAVSDLGYSDKELMDPSKAKKVAKLMFSDRYLGNAGFNPLVGKDFTKLDAIEQQREYEHSLGMNLDSFVRNGGVIDRYGGLRRGSITDAVERHFTAQTAQHLAGLAWQKAYDPDRSLSENMASYARVLSEDPILAHTGAKLDPGKFDSVDDIAQALTTSWAGRSSREGYQYKHCVDFN